MSDRNPTETGTITRTRTKTERKLKKPPLYKVLLHNDNYTTREFVVAVLKEVFHQSESDAVRIMLHVHHNGVGVAGVYTYEVAETKVKHGGGAGAGARVPADALDGTGGRLSRWPAPLIAKELQEASCAAPRRGAAACATST